MNETRKPPIIQTPLYERQKQDLARRQREHKRLVARIKKASKQP
jgi:hypothetical protein